MACEASVPGIAEWTLYDNGESGPGDAQGSSTLGPEKSDRTLYTRRLKSKR